MTQNVVTMLRDPGFRSQIRCESTEEPLPVIVVLDDDPLTYLFDRNEEQHADQTIAIAYDRDGYAVLHIDNTSSDDDDLRMLPGSTVGMLVDYLRLHAGRVVNCSVVRDGVTVELLDGPVLEPAD